MSEKTNNSFFEGDIRPDNLMKLKKPALEHDKQFLRDRRQYFVTVNCIACGSDNYVHWAEKEGFTYDICNDCSTIFMNPRADEKLLSEFYKQSKNYDFWNKYIFPVTNEVRREKIFRPRVEKVIEFCRKYKVNGGVLLEVGSAFGTFCELVKEQNYFERVIAVEPTPALAETCRKKNIETFEYTVEELPFEKHSADVIANFEVIEHLADPGRFIKQCAGYLKQGGLFICTCPNGMGFGTIIMREKSKTFDHEHINYFNTESLSRLLISSGFEVLEAVTPGVLDAELAHNAAISGEFDISAEPFLKYVLIDNWDKMGNIFQKFISAAGLSSNMWIIASKK